MIRTNTIPMTMEQRRAVAKKLLKQVKRDDEKMANWATFACNIVERVTIDLPKIERGTGGALRRAYSQLFQPMEPEGYNADVHAWLSPAKGHIPADEVGDFRRTALLLFVQILRDNKQTLTYRSYD